MTPSHESEETTKLRYITPALEHAGWDKHTQIQMEYFFTDGRVIVDGNKTHRGKRKKADYLLSYKPNIPLAILKEKKRPIKKKKSKFLSKNPPSLAKPTAPSTNASVPSSPSPSPQ